MFTWICPKCGKEVPPAYSECPNCASAAQVPVQPEQPAPVVTAPETALPKAPPPAPPPVAQAPPAPPPAAPVYRTKPGHLAVPAWMLSIMIAAALIIVGLTVIVWNESRTKPVAPAKAAPFDKVEPAAASQAIPAFRNVELTGLRLTEDAKQHAFVQVVVVNHSGADLGEIAAKVNLRAAAGQSQEPVGTFAFKTTLGPYESKDIKAPLQTKLRVYELPDWQFLRTEVSGR